MTPNDHYHVLADRMLCRPIGSWLPKPNARRDKMTDAIVSVVLRCGFSRMMITRLIAGTTSDAELEAHVRRGWTFMKSVYGETVAQDVVGQMGAIAVLGAVRTLYNVCRAEPETPEQMLAILPTMTALIVKTLAEYNAAPGLPIAEKVIQDIPLRQGERDSVLEACSGFDFSQRTLH